MRSPARRMAPPPSRAKPVMSWMSVDLPAPLGPITPSNSPRWRFSETPSTAVTPPKLHKRWSSASKGTVPVNMARSLCARQALRPQMQRQQKDHADGDHAVVAERAQHLVEHEQNDGPD